METVAFKLHVDIHVLYDKEARINQKYTKTFSAEEISNYLHVELRRLERVFSRTRARKHTRQLNDSKLAHRKLNLA